MSKTSERMADIVVKGMEQMQPKVAKIADEMVFPNTSGDHVRSIKRNTPVKDEDLASKKYVDDQIAGVPGGGNVVADANLTDETIVQGDGGAKKVKTSTATVAQVAANVAHAATVTGNPHVVLLDELGNPGGDKDFTMANKLLGFRYTAPTPAGAFSGAFEIEATGGFTGDLVHIHQHTGNPGATRLLAIEYDDTDVIPFRILNGVPATMFQVDNSGNVTLAGTVDGIDIATDVAANTLKDTNVTTNITIAEAPTNVSVQSSDGSNDTIAAADITNAGVMTTTMYDEHVVNTAHAIDSTQAHSDYLLNSGADSAVGPITITADNSSADTAYVPMILYNTDATPPAANTVPVGTIYIQYTA